MSFASAPRRRAGAPLLVLLLLSLGGAGGGEVPPVAATDLVGRFAGAETGRTAVGTPEAEAPPRPWVREDKGWLLVPFGTSVTYDLEVGPNAALLTANVSSRGSATGRLEVSWQPRDGEAVRVTPDLAAEPGRSVRLPRPAHSAVD